MSEQLTGFLNIDKPLGMTSHDVVAQIRRLLKQATGSKKVGHAGTLDPLATGVLIVCLGQATRLSEYAMVSTKEYHAKIHLGITTTTYDAEGEIVQSADASAVTQAQIEAALTPFLGAIEQVPPMYSAIKQGGKKLYDLARAGIEVERPARAVTIHTLNILAWENPYLTLAVTCSAGTYIRSLAYDLGQTLGVGAHLGGLVRTRSGGFTLENAIQLADLLANPTWYKAILDPQQVLQDWQSFILSPEQAQDIAQGRSIPKETMRTDEFIMAYLADGHLLAVLENQGNFWKPHKVFPRDS